MSVSPVIDSGAESAEPATSGPASASNDGTREKKRRRTSEPGGELSSGATRSERYWFNDGNIILHVEDTLFRVHRGVLCRHSSAFDDLVPEPQPDEKDRKDGMLEGCQVSGLPCDKAEDWERIFAVIYDLDGTYRCNGKRTTEILGSLLRLGKKYRFDRIYDEVMQRLRQLVPTTVEEWAGFPEELRTSTTSLYKLTKAVLEIGNQTLLPSLFLFCSAYPKDGTTAIFELSTATNIPQATIKTLAVGREKIIAACLELQFTWVFTSDDQHICEQPGLCQSAKQGYLQQFILTPRPRIALRSGSSVLTDVSLANICQPCKDDILAAQDASRNAMWDRLPSFFNLPAWADLQDL